MWKTDYPNPRLRFRTRPFQTDLQVSGVHVGPGKDPETGRHRRHHRRGQEQSGTKSHLAICHEELGTHVHRVSVFLTRV